MFLFISLAPFNNYCKIVLSPYTVKGKAGKVRSLLDKFKLQGDL